MHAEEPRGKSVNTCQLYSDLGNSSILAHGASYCGQSDKVLKYGCVCVFTAL